MCKELAYLATPSSVNCRHHQLHMLLQQEHYSADLTGLLFVTLLRRSERATAILAPVRALFFTSAILASNEDPPVSTFTLSRMKGVIVFPIIFLASASWRDCCIADSITFPEAACCFGTGTAIRIPDPRCIFWFAYIIFAHSSGESTRHGTLHPLVSVKKAGNSLVL